MRAAGTFSKSVSKKLTQAGATTGRILHIHYSSFVIPVKVDGTVVQGLVDTGASVSCINERIVAKVKMIKSTFCCLKSANDAPLEVVGEVDMPIEVEGRCSAQKFFVVTGLSHALILGVDFLTSHDVLLRCRDRKLMFSRRVFHDEGERGTVNAIPATETQALPKGIHEYVERNAGIVTFRAGCANISLVIIRIQEGIRPIKQNPRRKSFTECQVIDKEVTKMLEMDVIRPSTSGWVS